MSSSLSERLKGPLFDIVRIPTRVSAETAKPSSFRDHILAAHRAGRDANYIASLYRHPVAEVEAIIDEAESS